MARGAPSSQVTGLKIATPRENEQPLGKILQNKLAQIFNKSKTLNNRKNHYNLNSA